MTLVMMNRSHSLPIKTFGLLLEPMVQHHTVPRMSLYVPSAEEMPLPIKPIDVMRVIEIDIAHASEAHIRASWTDDTSQRELTIPWIGCTKVSAACDHCYAEAWDHRFGGERWGPHANRTRTKTWGNPIKWNRQAEGAPERPRVFVASLADVFDNHKSILTSWRRELWALIRQCPNLDFLMLTKRPQNIPRYLPEDWGDGYPNVWLGATVESQKEADRLA